MLAEQLSLVLAGRDLVDLLVGELPEQLRLAGPDHLGHRVGAVRGDRNLGAELDEQLGDLGAAAGGGEAGDRALGGEHVDHGDVAEDRDGEVGDPLGPLG